MHKKRLFTVFGFVLAVALVAVCAILLIRAKTPAADFQYADMSAIDDTVSPTGMHYVIENRAETCVGYGEEYHIEEKTLWGWKEAEQKGDLFWNAVLYEIPPHGSQECEVCWESVYGVLEREKVDMDNADFGSSVFFECILE